MRVSVFVPQPFIRVVAKGPFEGFDKGLIVRGHEQVSLKRLYKGLETLKVVYWSQKRAYRIFFKGSMWVLQLVWLSA